MAPANKDAAMALSDDTRSALHAYDSFTDFARCPDLLWPPDIYERLDDEVALLLNFEVTRLLRFERDGTATIVADRGVGSFPVGATVTMEGQNLGAIVRRTASRSRSRICAEIVTSRPLVGSSSISSSGSCNRACASPRPSSTAT
jgi:hypothetical protein